MNHEPATHVPHGRRRARRRARSGAVGPLVGRPWNRLAAVLALWLLALTAVAQEERPETLTALLGQQPELSSFLEFLEAGDLLGSLSRPVRLTVLAPNNAAWERLSEAEREGLLRNPGALNHVIRHHIAVGAAPLASLRRLDALTTLKATRIPIVARGEAVRLDGARVVEADLRAENGVVHVIDRVLVPGSATSVKSLLAGPPGR